ncbi:MAG: ATP-grasp domain-containing protein [Streptosporangiaceae bacterium]
MSLNIFVLGLDELNLEALEELPHSADYRFHPLLSMEELLRSEEICLPELLETARRQLMSFAGSIDAIVGYWDFPVSSMRPILCAEFGLRSPSLEAIVKCEHKYWTRLEQQKVTDAYPRFALVDLDDPALPPGLTYPLWLKPVKSVASDLAFRVAGPRELLQAVAAIRVGIGHFGRPFEHVLDRLDLPPEIVRAGGQACLAEEALEGTQFTVEGYSDDGETRVYGVVESLHYPGSPSFLRYQYPARLPESVFNRMVDITRRVIEQIGLDGGTFNIEFFWDAGRDAINLLEVNPRNSQSHARLFADVDGVPNHQCMVSLALGQAPNPPYRRGRHRVAAKWFLRRFADGVVRRSPTLEEVAKLEREIPATAVRVVAGLGARLSELPRQDSYSYELADIYIGASDEAELVAKYEQCAESLHFEFDE